MEFENRGQDEKYENETINSFESEDISTRNTSPNSELSRNDNNIKIYVFQPYARIRTIKLDSNYSLSVLNQIYSDNSTYIFGGQILDIEKSFSHYDIENESKLVIISSNILQSNPNLVQKWIDLTNKKDYFDEKINLNLKNDYRKEIARIKDIKTFKMESKKRKIGKFYMAKLNNQSNLSRLQNKIEDNVKDVKINVDFDPLDCPSNDPLPIIW